MTESNKQVKCVVLETDGTARVDSFSQESGLNKLQEWVGGHIEAIGGHAHAMVKDGDPGWVCYINEEGKLRRMPPNNDATIAWATFGWMGRVGDFCAGPAVFVGPPEGEGYDTDVPKFILRYFNLED